MVNILSYTSASRRAHSGPNQLATEFALKNVDVRVNAIAPGVYGSEMTIAKVTTVEQVQAISQALVPVPSGRAGT